MLERGVHARGTEVMDSLRAIRLTIGTQSGGLTA